MNKDYILVDPDCKHLVTAHFIYVVNAALTVYLLEALVSFFRVHIVAILTLISGSASALR